MLTICRVWALAGVGHLVCVDAAPAGINMLRTAAGLALLVSGDHIKSCAVRRICAAYTRRRELLVLLFHF